MHTQPPETAAPKSCPFCKSLNVKTTSKEVNASTYWRCAACDQIWNAGRLQHGRRTPPGRFN
jgi:transposase-like protein